jgi:hypothetical protein
MFVFSMLFVSALRQFFPYDSATNRLTGNFTNKMFFICLYGWIVFIFDHCLLHFVARLLLLTSHFCLSVPSFFSGSCWLTTGSILQATNLPTIMVHFSVRLVSALIMDEPSIGFLDCCWSAVPN